MTQSKTFKTISFTDRSIPSVDRYMTEVSRYPLLSEEEEVTLARTIRKGGPGAEAARDKLITGNLRFVISIAKAYHQLPFEDLIAEGNMGLLRAAETFDETKGFKFISYAVHWIRQHIQKAIDSYGTTIRLPQNKRSLVSRFMQMDSELLQNEHRPLSIDEFCSITGEDRDDVVNALSAARFCTSLDEPLWPGKDGEDDGNIPKSVYFSFSFCICKSIHFFDLTLLT